MSLETPSNQNPQPLANSFIESIDVFLDELSGMSARDTQRLEFYDHLTRRLQTISGATNVSVWVRGPDQTPVAVFSLFAGGQDNTNTNHHRITHEQFDQILDVEGSFYRDLHRQSTFAAGVAATSEEAKIISLATSVQLNAQIKNVYRDLVVAIAEIATAFERRLMVEQQQQKFSRLESFVQLLNNSNSSLDLSKVGYHITNDTRAFLNADRVWLFAADGRVKLIACSSVSEVNPRSKSFRHLQRVVAEAVRLGQSYSSSRDEPAFDSRFRKLDDYFQLESIDSIYVTLLRRPPTEKINGVLVTESFRTQDRMAIVAGLKNIAPCIESSLANSMAYSHLPFRRLWLGFGWLFDKFRLRSLPGTVLFVGLLAAVVLSLFLIKTDFVIDVEGQIRPVIERHVFAPVDSTVIEVLVDHGDQVVQNQVVVKLESKDYQLKINELQNELSAAAKQLEANQILRTQAGQEGKDALYRGQLTAEIEQNRLRVDSINKKINWYLEKTKSLEIKSPIDGQIISRDVRLSLLKRPVNRGNRLLSVADTRADWQIVLDVPDREFGYLLAARKSQAVKQWKIRYRFKSDLANTFESTISSTDPNNTFDDNGEAFVQAFVPVDQNAMDQWRVGQSVFGNVYCGRKSLFFVWTRDVRDFLRSNFFWL